MRTSGGVCGRSISWLIVAAMACLARDAMAQGPALAGTVVSRQNGQPVANAAVTIEGTSVTVVANAAGRFRLDLPTGRATVVVKAPGFLELRIPDAQATSAGGAPLIIEIDPTPNFMEHVQVTATKTALSIGDVAAQADIISRSTIDSRGDQTLTQAIAHVPGAIVSTQLGIFESVMLRGMPRGDPEFTNTLLLIDGVPQTLSTNGSRIVALPINDATNIEVVRGPNSALYGRTAIGGSINVRTADPTPEHQGGVDFTGGQFDMLKGVVKASGPIKQWGGYYVSAAKEQNHGFFVNKTTDDYTDGNWALFGKLTFTPDSKSFGSVTVNRVNSDNSTPTNEPIIDGRLLHEIDPRFDRLTNFNIPGTNYHQGESRVTANYARQLSSIAKISEVFGYRKVQHQFLEDGDFIASPFDLEAHTVSMYPFSQELNEDIIYQELRLDVSGKVGRVKHSATVGGSYEHTSGTLDSDFIFNDEDLGGFTINYLNPVIPPRSEWQHFTGSRLFHLGNSGLFGQYMIEPTPRLILSAGGRYDRLALDNIRDGGDKLEATFDAFSPKANVTFKLLGVEGDGRPTVNVYGAYAQAFLPPRAPSSLTPANTPPNLKPEDISSYEAGVKGSLAGGHVSLEATYFHMIEDGVVLSTRQGPVLPADQCRTAPLQGRRNGHQRDSVAKGVALSQRRVLQKPLRGLRD